MSTKPRQDHWVTSSLSAVYHSSGCFRVHTGHSEADFLGLRFERLLSSKAAVQIGRDWVKLGSAFGQLVLPTFRGHLS